MRKIIILMIVAIASSMNIYSQIKETFDSNSWQWTEYSDDKGSAYIIDGVMRLESKSNEYSTFEKVVSEFSTHSYLPMDPTKGFRIKCSAIVSKLEDNKLFGIIFDYIDDFNCNLFMIENDKAFIFRLNDGKIVGYQHNQFKIQGDKKKAKIEIEARYKGDELEFRVNDVQAILCRYMPIRSNGFGFFALGKCKVDIDEVEIMDY